MPFSTPSADSKRGLVPPSFARRDIVAEVQAAGGSFERQTIYRCLRRLTGHEPGCAHRGLEDLGNDQLRRHM